MIGGLPDTNVISELARPGCDPKVAVWGRISGVAVFNPWNDDPAGFVLSR